MKLALDHARLSLCAFAGAGAIGQVLTRAPGVILRMERVLPIEAAMASAPGALCITPSRLRRIVVAFRRWGYDIVSLDDMRRRIAGGVKPPRFACLTFDGGYVDVHDYAWPVLRELSAPFAVYLNTNFADHLGEAWWLAPRPLVESTRRLGLYADDKEYRFLCDTPTQKRAVREALEDILWSLPRDSDIRYAVRDLCTRYGVSLSEFNRLFLTWDRLRQMADDPLVSLGAMSVSGAIFAKTDAANVRREMDMARSVVEAATGRRPAHLAYPFGHARALSRREVDIARDLGFLTAVTTRQAPLPRDAAHHLHMLPRIDVGGRFGAPRYLRLFATGAARPRR